MVDVSTPHRPQPARPKPPGRDLVVVAGVVALVMVLAGLVAGLAITGSLDAESAPLVTMLLGLIGVAVPSLIALAKVQDVSEKVQETQEQLTNGVMRDNLHQALVDYEDPARPSPRRSS